MSKDLENITIQLILTDAIDDYSKKNGLDIGVVRDEIINSGAYDDLYDRDTGLWSQGPDYFLEYFTELRKIKNQSEMVEMNN